MGLIGGLFSLVFGGGRNVLRETTEVFRENVEAGAQRDHTIQDQAMTQFGAEFKGSRQGYFDRLIDGLNRLPRPALALGTLALFISAMVDPLWFAARMQGITLVPEPLWWLLGVIVSFYFGARHQSKAQSFQREIAVGMNRVPQAIANIQKLERLRSDSPGIADSGSDVALAEHAGVSDENPALQDWRKTKQK